jgi:hypothetical protein
MTVQQDRLMAVLSPMWRRIARGEVDLSQYSDEEILTGEIRMADGRLLPAPAELPDLFIREQIKRQLKQAQVKVRQGAMDALDVYSEIMNDEMQEAKDRLKAGQFFLDRFLGKPEQHVHHHAADADDARERLIERLLAARQAMPPEAAGALAQGRQPEDGIVDAELLDDGTLGTDDLEDLL